MPIRPIPVEMVKINYLGNTLEVTKESYDKTRDTIARADAHNEEIQLLVKWVEKELKRNDISGNWCFRTLNNLTEGLDNEMIKPRNYVSKEIFVYSHGGKELTIVLGELKSIRNFKRQLIEIINNQLNEWSKPRETRQRTFVMPYETTGTKQKQPNGNDENATEVGEGKGEPTDAERNSSVNDTSLDEIRTLFRRK